MKEINILLMGETGVGKSTFINSFVNYMHFLEFEQAEQSSDLKILIPISLKLQNDDLEEITLNVGVSDQNECHETGESATQDVKTYIFDIDDTTKVRLIDTPGIGDVRGVDQDNINCDYILDYLTNIDEVHAICFLLKPGISRINAYFEYCIQEILSRLEKSARDNIIFIFTNSRGSNYTPGSTIPCLKKILKKISDKPPHVRIPLTKDNIFSFDNEALSYLIGQKNGVYAGVGDENDYIRDCVKESWARATIECFNLINYIAGNDSTAPLKPHSIGNTVSINNARKLITTLSKPLVDISQLISDNIRVLDKHNKDLEVTNQTLEELRTKIHYKVIDLAITALNQPVTVCTSNKCRESYKVGDLTKWHYKQRCHNPCYLKGIEREIVGDHRLRDCVAMNLNATCNHCGCSYHCHQHIYYYTETYEKNETDTNVEKNITDKESAIQKAKDLIVENNKKIEELKNEHEVIMKTIAKFAFFLQANAISPFNDAYAEYIKYLINREKAMGLTADLIYIHQLEMALKRHLEIKYTFEEALSQNSNGPIVTPDVIMASIDQLYKLKNTGKKIQNFFNQQGSVRQREYVDTCSHVNINKNWRSRANSWWNSVTNSSKQGGSDKKGKPYNKSPEKKN